jgi:phosphate transport system substrate-binding protein
MPEDLIAWLPDPDGDQSYPIVTYTWIIAYKQYSDPAKMQTLKKVIKYCLETGQADSEKLGYVPLPEAVVAKATAALDNIGAAAGGGEAAK